MTTKTRSSSKVEEFPTELEHKMEAFFKSEAFRKILSTAVNVAVETAIKCFKNEFVELIDSRINVLEDMNKRLQEDLNKLNRRLNEVQNKAMITSSILGEITCVSTVSLRNKSRIAMTKSRSFATKNWVYQSSVTK
jgi:predicted RNase H-like nuclease (RuvC/YqgF family)